ncbi:MAG TPA: hypothetical protein VKK61_10325, partial [Tepidisphaeraceae bacterium]|nr:hypothetical protein [Tepidisphaeraceae bacterium]
MKIADFQHLRQIISHLAAVLAPRCDDLASQATRLNGMVRMENLRDFIIANFGRNDKSGNLTQIPSGDQDDCIAD